jgi:hypothetical protein
VQAVHAGIEAARRYLVDDGEHPHLVLCGCNSIGQLLNAADHLDKNSIKYSLFTEPDIGNEPTALATEPLSGDRCAPLSKFRLLTPSHFSEKPMTTLNPPAAAAILADPCVDCGESPSRSRICPGAKPEILMAEIEKCDVRCANVPEGVFQGRFGFHPCDYETFKMLKTIKKHYYQSLRQAGNAKRYYRKEPRNLFTKRPIRNEAGQVVRREKDQPIPRPVVHPTFIDISTITACPTRKTGTYVKHADMVTAFNYARMPQATAREVRPLSVSKDRIRELYEACQALDPKVPDLVSKPNS